MIIKQVQISSYKSFGESVEIPFEVGFNVVVGKNNSGKTALLEALSTSFVGNKHRSIKGLPGIGSTKIRTQFLLDQRELEEIAESGGGKIQFQRNPNLQLGEQERLIREGILNNNLLFEAELTENKIRNTFFLPLGRIQSTDAIQFDLKKDPRLRDASSMGLNPKLDTPLLAAELLKKRIYKFKAERFNVGQYAVGDTSYLETDARNLAQVLHKLHIGNRAKFDRYFGYVRRIFPEITQISFDLLENPPTARIQLWGDDPALERSDLTVSLQESGTGIGQILAILYVVVNSSSSTVIVIDEPQSFLHPGAVRVLFEILRQEFPLHQYIFSTHSPDAISSSNPSTITLLRKIDAQTVVTSIDARETDQLEQVLNEVGARLSDVFGADKILWVEGLTEERSFPLIVDKLKLPELSGLEVLGVLHTAEFEGKRLETALELYERLSSGKSLIPPAIGFLFDKENKVPAKIEEAERRGKIKFLPRKMFENYLLVPSAISRVMNTLLGEGNQKIKVEDIKGWFDANKFDEEFIGNESRSMSEEEWFKVVNGAKLLNRLFADLMTGFDYEKVIYGKLLTLEILKEFPDNFAEIEELIKQLVASKND